MHLSKIEDEVSEQMVQQSVSEEETSDDTSEIMTDSEEESDENAESLSASILREIEEGTYTCLVCTSEIDAYSKIWSCTSCYRVYDLDCIRDWALRGSSTDTNKNWRCPSCHVATNKAPKKFTCWCGKKENPPVNTMTPFSCGSICNFKYEDCVHSCSSECHPAQHPVCGAIGPVMKCECGKSERQLPCCITPYKQGWHCNNSCVTKLCPMGHKCSKGCHKGFCGECKEIVRSKCYCGQNELDLPCYKREPKLCNFKDGPNLGFGKCKDSTVLYHDCQIHSEVLTCQPPKKAPVCKLAPSIVKTCYCGKTPIKAGTRTKCTDPIPECENVCGKELPCGCKCLLKCHVGDCKCYSQVTRKCACGHSEFIVPCGFQGKPKCHHKCSVLLNCRRHHHNIECCSYEQIALKRERDRKKAVRKGTQKSIVDLNEAMTIEPVHICTQICNKLKSCGKHECEAVCHAGPCGVCLESSSEDLICHCGKTVIPAPVRCGTKIECKEQCIRETECGHAPEPHFCHGDDVSCPKCTKMVKKICDCGTKEVPYVLCSQSKVSCGRACTVPKNCGHKCGRTCSALCTVENNHVSSAFCQSECGKRRVNCPHYCSQKCHAEKIGKSKNCDILRCSEEITIKCGCGRKSQTTKCGASTTTLSKIYEKLDCDETCSSQKREEQLKMAFLGLETLQEESIYSQSILSVFAKQPTWCSRVEIQLRNFIESNSDKKTEKIFYFFPSFTAPQRKYVKELAESFKLYVGSQGKEPNRSVYVVLLEDSFIPPVTVKEVLIENQRKILEQKRAEEMKANEINDADCNALLIDGVFFGITRIALLKHFTPAVKSGNSIDIQWLKGSSFIVSFNPTISENELFEYMKLFRSIVKEQSLAFDVTMCLLDGTGENVLKKQNKLIEKEPLETTKIDEHKEEVVQTENSDLNKESELTESEIEKLHLKNEPDSAIEEQNPNDSVEIQAKDEKFDPVENPDVVGESFKAINE